MKRSVSRTVSAHKYWELARDANLVDRDHADQEIARLQRKRASAHAIRPRPPSKPTADAAAYSAYVRAAKPHAPRGQSSGSIRRQSAKKESRRERYRKRQEAWTRAFLDKLLVQGHGTLGAAPRPIPLRVWRMVQLLRESPPRVAEKARRIILAQLPRSYVERLKRAAFRPAPALPAGRKPERASLGRRSDRSRVALRVMDLGIMMWFLSKPCRRRGFSRVVTGMGRGVFCSALRDFGSGQYASLSVLFGTDARTETPGAAPALEQAGLLHYGQVPADRATPQDRGPSGYAYNAYWIRKAAANDAGPPAPWQARDPVPDSNWVTVLDLPAIEPPDPPSFGSN